MNTRTDKILGASFALAAFSFITPSHVLAQTCVTPPTCESLGYTKSESDCAGKQALKCPFDNTKVFCSENTSGDNCTNPKVGYIMYSDMSCSEDVIEDKVPIGVIGSIAPNALVSLQQGSSTLNPSFCSTYAPDGIDGWSVSRISLFYKNKDIINQTLKKLGAETIGHDGGTKYLSAISYDYHLSLPDYIPCFDFENGKITSVPSMGGCGVLCSKTWGNPACSASSCTSYSLDSCPEHGTCESCSNNLCPYGTTKYKLTKCDDSYVLVGGTYCMHYYFTEDTSLCRFSENAQYALICNCDLHYTNTFKYYNSCQAPDSAKESFKESMDSRCQEDCRDWALPYSM